MDFDWKSLIKKIAPVLGTALGGPLGGMATAAIANAILPPDHDPAKRDELLQEALSNANPEMLLKVQQANQDFEIQIKKLGLDLDKINADDRANARGREIALKDRTPATLAAIAVIGFFGILALLMFFEVKLALKDLLLIMIGGLRSDVSSVYNYYFGSSSGSAEQRQTIAEVAKQ